MNYFLGLLAEGEVVEKADRFFDSAPMGIIFAIGAVFLSLYFLVTTLRRVRRSQMRSQRTIPERVDALRPKIGPMQAQINELMAELADLSRQVNGQIDTRIAKLEILLDDAERTIDRLEQATKGGESGVSFRHGATHRKNVTNSGGEIRASEIRQEWTSGPENHIASDQETRSVLELAGQGKNAIAIAQELDRPVGEIELILALNKK